MFDTNEESRGQYGITDRTQLAPWEEIDGASLMWRPKLAEVEKVRLSIALSESLPKFHR